MKVYQVKLKSTVTAWVTVLLPDAGEWAPDDLREWAADEAVDQAPRGEIPYPREDLTIGPWELAHEELDESVREVSGE